MLIAARVAPVTRHIGLVPTAVVTHTEPFHLSKAIATLDYVSQGRAGVRLQVTARAHEAAHFGRRTMPVFRYSQRGDPEIARLLAGLMDEAADYAEALRRLWDSWEDDAEIRDAATGRFVDRDKLHYIDFAGEHFRVKGPSITPRPPQGQPVIAALAHSAAPYQLVARAADVGFVTPHDAAQAAAIVAEIRGDQDAAGRAGQTLHVSVTWWCSWRTRPPRRPGARPGWTSWPGRSTAATRWCSPGPRRSWPAFCRTGRRPGCPGSGCGPG